MDIATTLLEYGADANAVTRQGIASVHLAAQEGHVDMVSLLLSRNANVNLSNKVTFLFLCKAYNEPLPLREVTKKHALRSMKNPGQIEYIKCNVAQRCLPKYCLL